MALLCALVAPAVASIEPGQWKVTTNTTMNGGTLPPQVALSFRGIGQRRRQNLWTHGRHREFELRTHGI
jgi:hypothetical protein